MNAEQALTAVREILYGPRSSELDRLERIRQALDPSTPPSVELPKNVLPVMANLAVKSKTNLLPLVLDTFSQVMKVDGYTPTVDDGGRGWGYWQQNRFDALQTGVHRSAMAYGASYVVIGQGTRGPAWTPRSPLTMTALYADPTVDEWPMLALDVDGPMIKLYDEEFVYFIGQEQLPRTTFGTTSGFQAGVPGGLEYIDRRPHGFAVCPVVRFRDRMLLAGEEQFGIIEPLLQIQQRIDETVFGMLTAQFYAAFKQRYVIGWVPQDEYEALQASTSALWTFDDKDVKVGELSETDLTRYIQSKDSAKADMAAVAQVPAQALGQQGISNVSGDVMDGLKDGKDFKAGEISTSLGESYEQLFRASAHLMGDDESANDFAAEVRWKNTTAVKLSTATDAFGKWVAQLGVNQKLARKMLPGWTDQMEAENEKLGPSTDPNGDAAMQTLFANVGRQSTTAQ